MATNSDVEFIDRPEGNQFIARIWLTNQKSKNTTRKPLNTTQKRILDYLKNYPKATRHEVSDVLGDITESGVKFNIGLLQQYGYLRRKDGRKNGHWEIITTDREAK